MKRLFKILFSFLLVIILLVGGTVGVLAYLIIDNTSLTNEKYENQELDINVPINNLLAKSLEDTSTTASVNFSLNPLDLDYVLYSLVDSIDTQIEPLKINGSKVE